MRTKSIANSALICIVQASCFSSVRADCDAAMVNAFKDVYQSEVTSVTAEQLYRHICSSKSTASGVDVSVPLDGIPIGIQGSHESVSRACATRNYQYFHAHRADILISSVGSDVIKQSLIESCFDNKRLRMVVKETPAGIAVTAFGNPQTSGKGYAVKVRRFWWVDPNTVERTGPKNFDKKGPEKGELNISGTSETFRRVMASGTPNAPVTFTLTTERDGEAIATLPGLEVVKVDWRVHYPYNNDRLGRELKIVQCQAKIEGGDWRDVGPRVSTLEFGGNTGWGHEVRQGFCSAKFGPRLRLPFAGQPAMMAVDQWETSPLDETRTNQGWNCVRNGRVVGRLECPADPNKDKLCTTYWGKVSYCAGRYAETNRTAAEEYRDLLPAKTFVAEAFTRESTDQFLPTEEMIRQLDREYSQAE